MELEDLKTAWQRDKLERPCKISPEQIAAETRRKAMELDRKYLRDQVKQIAWGLFAFVLIMTGYNCRQPHYATVGMILMWLSIALMLGGTIILRIRFRTSHPELSPKEYLEDQKKRVLARLALYRRNLKWFFAPGVLGLLLWRVVPTTSVPWLVGLTVLLTIQVILCLWWIRRIARKEFAPILEDIDRELAELEKRPVPQPE